MYMYRVSVSLFTQVYEMFDLDPASWAALGSSVGRSICPECRVSWVQIPPEATHFHFFIASGVCLSFFLSFFLSISSVIMYILRFSVWCLWWINYPLPSLTCIYRVSVSLFTQVYEMFDLDPASWAALVAQLVGASVRSTEYRVSWVQIPPEATHFHFFIASGVCLSFFLSFFLSISSVIMYYLCVHVHVCMFGYSNLHM